MKFVVKKDTRSGHLAAIFGEQGNSKKRFPKCLPSIPILAQSLGPEDGSSGGVEAAREVPGAE